MPDFLQYDFMIRAFIAGLLIAFVIPFLGNFLVARRYSLIADSLAHVSLAGVGAGLLFGMSPVALALPATVLGALLLEWLRQQKQLSGEISLAILMSSGLAVAVVLANLAQDTSVDFASFLFGSITTTTTTDLYWLFGGALAIAGLLAYHYQALLHIAIDEDSARIMGYRVTLLNYLLAVMTAVMVTLSLRVVGGLLVGALLVIPVVAASQHTKSFLHTIIASIAIAAIAVMSGLLVAFYVGIAAGGAIVLCAVAFLVVAMATRRS